MKRRSFLKWMGISGVAAATLKTLPEAPRDTVRIGDGTGEIKYNPTAIVDRGSVMESLEELAKVLDKEGYTL